ncbi:glutamyl aminopeptidase isoform X1 [Hydra vulgaris]|uniref:glutamyl aminopeptidase isoform X1 n=1 Tax=Hydra vulgaris TaxID=6087 RepID=UPI001F5E9E35|nr:glutamyl aminopeptidase [Hydra vulgaris]
MTFQGMGSIFLDELAFQKLWIDRETEKNNGCKNLEKEKNVTLLRNKIEGWGSLIVGIFFISGIAGFGSYHALYMENGVPINDSGYYSQTPEMLSLFDQVSPVDLYDKEFLPGNIFPESYLLYVYPDIVKKRYQGMVKIYFKCVAPTSTVVFHSSQHTISKIKLMDVSNIEVRIKNKYRNRDKQYVVLQLDKALVNGTYYNLLVGFENDLTENSDSGIYLTRYFDGSQKPHQMISTMFEPRTARKSFPCFDEPIYKARFKVIIQHVKDYFALSNMPAEKKVSVDKNVETFFETSVPMSSYLVVFAITEYQFRELVTSSNTKIRAFAPIERLDETELALSIAPLALKFYSEKFQINYSLPKLDLVPVTELTATADENWGMIVFQENSLLYKDESVFNIEFTTKTINHEVAHQWFGNLVTMKSWNDLWLKESFATFLQSLPTSKYYPTWDVQSSSYIENYVSSFNTDASRYTHAILPNATDLSTLESMYDVITYSKGASVLAMIKHLIGEKNFFEGLRNFLLKYQYSNAGSDDFFMTLNESQSSIDLVDFSKKWITTAGFPLVTVIRKENQLLFNQKKFLLYGVEDENPTWPISLSVRFFLNNGSISNSILLLTSREALIDAPDNITMYKVNMGAFGFYQVNYDKNNWLALLSQMKEKHTIFSVIDRSNILNDVFHLSKYNYVSFQLSLMFTEYLKNETHYAPWFIGLQYLKLLQDMLFDEAESTCLKSYILDQIEPVIMELNLKKEHSHVETKLISLLVSTAVMYEYKSLAVELNNWFLRWLISADVKIPKNIYSSVLYVGIKYGTVEQWEILFDRYLKSVSYKDTQLYLSGLASTDNTDLIRRLLLYSSNDTIVAKNHRLFLLKALCSNRNGRYFVQHHIIKEWDRLYENMKGFGNLKSLLQDCFGNGKTYSEYGYFLDFMKEKNLGRFKLEGLKILDQININIKMVNRKDEIASWLYTVRPICNLDKKNRIEYN